MEEPEEPPFEEVLDSDYEADELPPPAEASVGVRWKGASWVVRVRNSRRHEGEREREREREHQETETGRREKKKKKN